MTAASSTRNGRTTIVAHYCDEPRYKVNKNTAGSQTIPRKKLWYFPIADRLKRLFLCPKTAKDMTWHAENRQNSDEVIHPSRGEAWKHFQHCFPGFAAEDRNAYVSICTDGFSPSNNSGNHSIWPVFYTAYNLPSELCMTEPFTFMAMIISGPRSPGEKLGRHAATTCGRLRNALDRRRTCI